MIRVRDALIWSALVVAVAVPLVAAFTSPLLAWRQPVYIIAGISGVIGMSLMLFQPLLIAGYLPGLPRSQGRLLHRWVGGAMVLCVVIHVIGLWITSPPDMIDALLFTSPTLFSVWGVIAMWGVFAVACLAIFRYKWRLRPRTWRLSHRSLAGLIVVATVLHAMMIEGTMETLTKSVLCALILLASVWVLTNLKTRK